MLKTLIIE